MFSYLLWVTRGDKFAAIGAVAGRLVGDLHPTIPKPVVHIAGKRDDRVKFDDQKDTVKEARKLDEANGKESPAGKTARCSRRRSVTR